LKTIVSGHPAVTYGVTVSILLLVTLSDVVEILTLVVVVTLNVVIVNVADICPPSRFNSLPTTERRD
jgi:hypothetical protein